MGELIREICIVSIVCAVACNIAPDGSAKRVLSICCCVIMMLIVLKPIGEFDMGKYADLMARYREIEKEMNMDAQDTKVKLDRLVIEQEYVTYIMDKASEKGVALSDACIRLEWNTDGYWVPCGLELISDENDLVKEYFSLYIISELGISEDKIIWLSPD